MSIRFEVRRNAEGDARIRRAGQVLPGYETVAFIDVTATQAQSILGDSVVRNQLLAVFKGAYETGQADLALASNPVALEVAPAIAEAGTAARRAYLLAQRQAEAESTTVSTDEA